MKIAYCILCHKVTNPLRFTVDYLSRFEENKIYMHVDRKSDIAPFEEAFAQANVTWLTERIDVAWGSVSQVDATLALLKAATQEGFDYVFLISGDDIPIASHEQILAHLERYKGREFIAYQDERFNRVDPRERVKHHYPDMFFKKRKTLMERVGAKLHGVGCRLGFFNNPFYKTLPRLYKGTSWFTISHGASCFILKYLEDHPYYRLAFQYSFCCDEVFFHTILKQSPFNKNIIRDPECYSDSLRYIDWKTGPDYPRTLDESDFARMKSSGMLFARKVAPDIDISSLACFVDKTSEQYKERLFA